VVNAAFVKRLFERGEGALGHPFGLDLPRTASTYRVVSIVHDAQFAGFALHKPARPMFYVPLAQYVHYPDLLMRRFEMSSHGVSAGMLVTDDSPGALEPQLTRILSEID